MNYVLGFHFSTDGQRLTLLLKDRGHLAGLWNGIGGKIEGAETPMQAMHREGGEEASLHGAPWEAMGKFDHVVDGVVLGTIYLFRAFSAHEPRQMEAERVEVWSLENLPANVVPNLRWLVPAMADEAVYQIEARTA